MVKPSILETSLAKLSSYSIDFSDMVLGPTLQAHAAPETEISLNVPGQAGIPFVVDFLVEKSGSKGKITEVWGFEPTTLQTFLVSIASDGAKYGKTLVFLGVEKEIFQGMGREDLFVMEEERASHLLFALGEFIASNAADIVVINEILLKVDSARTRDQSLKWLVSELKKIKRQILGCETQIVLLNPATSERKQILNELETICSYQIMLHNEVEKDEIKDRY